ncbi:hypothetical protein ACTUSR_22495 [Pantoea stewartii subsp. indologenes]|nr:MULTISPECIES: hypothetical protein [Pantoea]MDF7787244.1 hypothetical protein [Pantoea stewartii]PXV70705.1 hypothetical protein C7433_1182 [Pantoea sp. PNA 03-3]
MECELFKAAKNTGGTIVKYQQNFVEVGIRFIQGVLPTARLNSAV